MFRDGRIIVARCQPRGVDRRRVRHGRFDRIEREMHQRFEDDGTQARNTHSAIFAEVKIDEQLGVLRVTRVVCAVAAGRILNPKTARSQILGGVVWGIGMALHEEAMVDHGFGRVMNDNFAEYHVPVNADVDDIEVIFVDEPDQMSTRSGSRASARSASWACRGHGQCDLSCHGQARTRPSDHDRQAVGLSAHGRRDFFLPSPRPRYMHFVCLARERRQVRKQGRQKLCGKRAARPQLNAITRGRPNPAQGSPSDY